MGTYHAICILFSNQGPNGQWYEMNDSRVSVVQLAQVLQKQAYILFYSKADVPSAAPQPMATTNGFSDLKNVDKQSSSATNVLKTVASTTNGSSSTEVVKHAFGDDMGEVLTRKPKQNVPSEPLMATSISGSGAKIELHHETQDDDSEENNEEDEDAENFISEETGAEDLGDSSMIHDIDHVGMVLHAPFRYECSIYNNMFR